jgi:hypothetical protein
VHGHDVPALTSARISTSSTSPRNVGRLTVANTAGTIVGSIVTGYFVLPVLLGSERSLVAVAIAVRAARRVQRAPVRQRLRRSALAMTALLPAIAARGVASRSCSCRGGTSWRA